MNLVVTRYENDKILQVTIQEPLPDRSCLPTAQNMIASNLNCREKFVPNTFNNQKDVLQK